MIRIQHNKLICPTCPTIKSQNFNIQTRQHFNIQTSQQHFTKQTSQQHFTKQTSQQHFTKQTSQQHFNKQTSQQHFNIQTHSQRVSSTDQDVSEQQLLTSSGVTSAFPRRSPGFPSAGISMALLTTFEFEADRRAPEFLTSVSAISTSRCVSGATSRGRRYVTPDVT